MADRIGFVGLGSMGKPMALNLVKGGYDLLVFDSNPVALKALVDAGATAAASVKDLADNADCIMASLPTPDVVKAVALGEGGVAEGSRLKTFIDLSTTGPR
ncbi:MAG: NAD(P)-binding domain-containing protein, partial [Alphaproteobacteria bacterium]